MKIILLSHTPNPEKIIAASAKLCYSPSDVDGLLQNLTPESIETFINKLISLGHESPLEHCSFTFAIEGVSRSLTHQLVRHRLASYSQKSQRYVSEDQFDYIIPKSIESNPTAKKVYDQCMGNLQSNYEKLRDLILNDILIKEYGPEDYVEKDGSREYFSSTLDVYNEYVTNGAEEQKKEYKKRLSKHIKTAIEDARYILPNACETKIIMTMNIRSLLHYFQERCCNRAQTEHRELAWALLEKCKDVSPLLFKNAGPSCIKGKCKEGPMYCGHPYTKTSKTLNSSTKENTPND